MDKKNCGDYEVTCSSCGRPWAICKEKGGCSKCGDVRFCEYGRKASGCIREKQPGCPMQAVIPSVTVDTIEGIKGLADCFVHVADINTTFYIDDEKRLLTAWEGMVSVYDYDYDNNPLKLRNQISYDIENSIMAIWDGQGVAHKVTIDDLNNSYTFLTDKPQINGVELDGDKSSSDLGLQSVLSAGQNITIDSQTSTISATDTTYTAGSNIQISNENVISATDTTYTAGNGIEISDNEISATKATVSSLGSIIVGDGLNIDGDGKLSVDDTIVDYQKSVIGERIINEQQVRIACVGDSLTWCQKPSDTSTQLTTWSDMLSTFINNWYNIPNLLTCYNFGVKGQKASASVENFDTYIGNNPHAIIWGYGTNDMSQGVTVDEFLADLRAFYEKCIEHEIEFIVLIAPPSFQTQARRDKMLNLAKAERLYCEKYGIKYVDMFEYVDNLYSSQAYAHNVLQSDNTHFADYTCYRDAILSTIFGVTFNQDAKSVDYIDIGNARNYFHCNGNAITVSGGVNMFNLGWRLRQGQSGETGFTVNLHLTRKSKIYLVSFGNSTAGKIEYSINGDTAETIDTMVSSSSSSTSDKSLSEILQIGGVQNAGLKQIEFSNPTYPGDSDGRIYAYGFIIQEIPDVMMDSDRSYQLTKQMQIWSGNETSLTSVLLSQDVSSYNKLLLEFGSTAAGISYVEIYPHSAISNFSSDGANTVIPYFVSIPTSGGAVAGTLTIDHENNTVSFVADGTVAIRRIYGVMNNANKGYLPVTQYDINSGIDAQ